jgi:hypothetical protein
VGEKPPVAVRPRISNSLWPGPLVFMETPGVSSAIERKSDSPRDKSSASEMAVMLMGVFCTVDSRFSAVTTISSSAPDSFAAALLSVSV